MKKTGYLPPICWVHRPRTLHKEIEEGIDLCPTCAEKSAQTYKKQYPSHAKEIFASNGENPSQGSSSPAQCCDCFQPLSCMIISTGKLLNTQAKWSRHQ